MKETESLRVNGISGIKEASEACGNACEQKCGHIVPGEAANQLWVVSVS